MTAVIRRAQDPPLALIRRWSGRGAIPYITQKLAEPPCGVLRSDAAVDGLQEVQLFNQFVRLLILLRRVVLGLAVVVHWTSSFLGSGVATVDLAPCRLGP